MNPLDPTRLAARLPARTQRQLEGRVATVLVDNADGTIDVDLAGQTLTVPIIADVSIGAPVTLCVWDGNLVALALVPYVLPNPLVSVAQVQPNWSQWLYFDGVNATRMSTPDTPTTSITGDIDIAFLFDLEDWTPAAYQTFGNKWTAAGGQQSYVLHLAPSGVLDAYWSTNGVDFPNATSTVATGFAPGTKMWVRWTMDVNNGAGSRVSKFYTSPVTSATDPTPLLWTQLGATVTTAGTTSIFNSTATLMLGGQNNGVTFPPKGKGYGMLLNNAYDTANLWTTNVIKLFFGQTEPTVGAGWPLTNNLVGVDDSPAPGPFTWTIAGTGGYLTQGDLLSAGLGFSLNLTTGRTTFNEWIAGVEWEENLVAVTGAYVDVISRTLTLPFTGETVLIKLFVSAVGTDLGENETIFLTPRIVAGGVTFDGTEIAKGQPDATGALGSVSVGAGSLDVTGSGLDVSGVSGPASAGTAHTHTDGSYTIVSHAEAQHGIVGSPSISGTPTVTLADIPFSLTDAPHVVGPLFIAGSTLVVTLRAKGTNYTGTPRFRVFAEVFRVTA